MQQSPVNSVLVVDQENDFFMQMIECVGNKESTLCIESAGIDVKRLVKEIEKKATQDSGLNSNDTI